jgi:hypothetical protein
MPSGFGQFYLRRNAKLLKSFGDFSGSWVRRSTG